MTAEKWDAITHCQPSQTRLVIATFARAQGMSERIEATKKGGRGVGRRGCGSRAAIEELGPERRFYGSADHAPAPTRRLTD